MAKYLEHIYTTFQEGDYTTKKACIRELKSHGYDLEAKTLEEELGNTPLSEILVSVWV